ncbi:MAG TPA: pyridoxamine 5'-phosphate oxidase family protein [Methylomirabilota bacterium]|nr:pyridoxamine 5'-phosphate oxidase family protein [Methylomirabilota bacterium]
MNRRPEITMSPDELRAFLDEEYTLTCASLGPSGRPHLMPLWYVRQGDAIACWTYGASQKVRNLERLPQATLLVEAGEKYDELRGVMLECDVEIVRDRERILDIGVALAYRYGAAPPDAPADLVRAGAARRGAKRVGLLFRPTRIVSWDHRKLGGGGH